MRWVGESSSGRLAPVPAPAGHMVPPDPYGGSEPSAVGAELPFLRDMWRHRTRPRAGRGSGAVGPVMLEPDPWGPAALPLMA